MLAGRARILIKGKAHVIFQSVLCLLLVKKLERARNLIVAALTMTVLCVSAVSAADEQVSAGPPINAGDGVPDGNQYIQPDTIGRGPAPSAGDGESEGPEWP